MSDIEYITTRDLTNSANKAVGKVKIAKLFSEKDATMIFKCPECGFEDNRREPWSEPFVTGEGKNQSFTMKCSKCGYKSKIMKLRKEIKKK